MDVSKLRVTSSEIGGGFGGKTHVWAEPVALALSRKAGRPVKLVMTRDEVFRASGPTSATSIDVKIGARKDGTITAAEATLRYSCGPYAGMWAELGAMTAFACYDLENVKTVGYEVLVNRPKTAAYRAPSAPMAAFAVESVIDELAKKIGMDPVEFRIKNAAQEGTKIVLRSGLWPDRHRPDARSGEEPSAHEGAARQEPGPRHGLRLLVQLRRPDLHRSQHRHGRHGLACRRNGRRRRLARLAVAGGGGGTRHPL